MLGMSSTVHDGIHACDKVRRMILDGDVEVGYARLAQELYALRWALGSEDWSHFCEIVQSLPLFQLFQQDPMVRHCVAKPRGYAGDAKLLDMIYDGRAAVDEPMSDLGARLFDCGFRATPCRAVRERATALAGLLDECADGGGAEVLAVACGHLREAERSTAIVNRRFERFVALDQDALSLAVVKERHAASGVSTERKTVRSLVRQPRRFGAFDLVYTAGLYDYLPQAFAKQLTESLFLALRPGGKLRVANFTPGNPSIGLMEAIMQWRLIYRTEIDMWALAEDLQDCADARVFSDSTGTVCYLEATKAN